MSINDDIRASELRVAEVIGGLIEFWGFKAIQGRIWAILYLSPDPLPAAEICDRLQISTGAASMALNDLQKWGVVKKAWRPGERKDYYEPETSIWKMVTRVYRERELGYVRAVIESFEELRKLLGRLRANATADEKKRLKFIDARLASLLTLSRIGEGLLTMLTAGQAVDPRGLFEREEE
jgi:DNA-binding transcriptional regulator GbsR (MarR family)